MDMKFKGRRVAEVRHDRWMGGMEPGDYGKDADGLWMCRPIGDFLGTLGDGTGKHGHVVAEHEDGTITVSPSILISDGKSSWHGFLEKGVWREC